MATKKPLSPEEQELKQQNARRKHNITSHLSSYDKPIIHVDGIKYTHISGKPEYHLLSQVKAGDTISFGATLTMMQDMHHYDGISEELSIRNLPVDEVLKLGRGEIAIVTTNAVLCTMDIYYQYMQQLKRAGLNEDQIHCIKCASQVIDDEFIAQSVQDRDNNIESIYQLVEQCLSDSVRILGISDQYDDGAIQMIDDYGSVRCVDMKNLAEGDVIVLGSQCVDQMTGEYIDDYGTLAMVMQSCQIGYETFVLTDVGMVTNADLSLEIEQMQSKMQEYDHNSHDYDQDLEQDWIHEFV